MKKRLILPVMLILAFVFASCAPAAQEVEKSASDDFEFTVAISLNNLDTYQTMMTDFLEDELAQIGGTLIQYNADGSLEKQLADVEAITQTDVDVIVIQAVDPDGTVTAIQTAHNSGIPTLVYQLTVNADVEDFDARVVTKDDLVRGKVQAEWMKAWMDEHPDEHLYVGSMQGEPNGGKKGYLGFNTIYDDPAYSDRITEVIVVNGGWMRDKTIVIMEDWLIAHPELNVIQCENDEMALGAVTTLLAAGKDMDDYLVLGMNGDPDAQVSIKNGELAMSAANSKRGQSKICAEVCKRLAEGERWEGEEKFHYTDATYKHAMDINTVDEMIASGLFE